MRDLFHQVKIEHCLNVISELSVVGAVLNMSEAHCMLVTVGDLKQVHSKVHAMGGDHVIHLPIPMDDPWSIKG